MGLLDDAIREHLDLKRRRGADPTEIERAEREALGPVRRAPELTGEEAPAPEPLATQSEEVSAVEEWEPFQEDPELHDLEEPDELAPYEHPRAPAGDPLIEDEPFSGEMREPLPPEPADFRPAPVDEPPAPHPAEPPPAPQRADEPSTRVDQETEEYELEPEEEVGDDVLETTPEFLQDAPEHDRLWFEQRPPRDFDFDG
ncbi:MAG: hypothetical protein JO027_19485 [Solirubrobacterales bacterium]|nr:hypothetical protein [Solirubrobacterales bacterium]